MRFSENGPQDSGPPPLPPIPSDHLSDLLDDIGTPNCPGCLHQMEPVGDDAAVHWECFQCGLVRQ